MSCSAASMPLGSAAARAETHRIIETTRIRKINALSQLYRLTAALRHNCDLDIARLAHYLLHNCFPEPFPPGAGATSPHKDLGDEMGARELSDGARHVLTFYYVRLDAQVSCEAHVALDGFVEGLSRGYVNGQAIGAQIVRHALAAADEDGGRRVSTGLDVTTNYGYLFDPFDSN